MGKSLHDQIVAKEGLNIPCRIYAPVGSHEDLLPYLVRRLLENGANSSFVNQIADDSIPIKQIIASPVEKIKNLTPIPNPKIPLPRELYGNSRVNSAGIDFSDRSEIEDLAEKIKAADTCDWQAAPMNRAINSEIAEKVVSPTDHRQTVGYVEQASKEDIDLALQRQTKAQLQWDRIGVAKRSEVLIKASDLLEQHHAQLMTMAIREAGKTLPNAISEVREATDFCRYYSQIARSMFATKNLPGPTGETNQLRLHARGAILCISPWNFPIAIFTGQIAAALVCGNSVIAKPAEQTPLVAAKIVELFHKAGVPEEVLQLLPGRGEVVGAALVEDPRIKGVIFTGSTETAKLIQQSLAKRQGPIVPLIAETGGINAVIADSSALPEQLVHDVIVSAFDSAGQRCSALRLLFIQEEIADKVITMLKGAMAELTVGDPMFLATDVGPVIDNDAQKILREHAKHMQKQARLIYEVKLPQDSEFGSYISPQAYELNDLSVLTKEVFGPILHVIRYRRDDLDEVIDRINALGYGLTFGIQSRIDETVDYIQQRIRAGNIYVNRNIIGAVVGVQPFGGSGLSGTGPKAGGPHYLSRLCEESTLTIDTTAAGGNATLMALED